MVYGVPQGDLNLDGKVDLQDAIHGLHVVTGVNPTLYNIEEGVDVNQDNRIGMAEVNYILKAAKRWRPGYYSLLYTGDNNRIAKLTELENEPQVQGVMVRMYWDDLQTDVTTYNWVELDALILEAERIDKLVFLMLIDKGFNGSPDKNSCHAPGFVKLLYNGEGCMKTANGGLPQYHKAQVRDARIAFIQALAERYDDRGGFGGLQLTESAPSLGNVTKPADFTNARWADQLIATENAANAVLEKSVFIQGLNYLAGNIERLVDNSIAAGSVIGGPDTLPPVCTVQGRTDAQNYINQLKANGEAENIAIGFQTQGPEISNTIGNPAQGDCTVPEMVAEYHNNGAQLMFILRMNDNPSGGPTWQKDFLPYIRNNPQVNNTCPENFKRRCSNNI